MPIYDLRCGEGHVVEVIQSFSAPLPPCPACGGATAKLPSLFGIGGVAGAGLPPTPERMPQTWKGTYRGDREYVTSLRRTADERRRLEERHPELAGDRRPILAHEGRYEQAPLRAGDVVPGASATPGHGHAPGHSHGPGHSPGHSPGHGHGHTPSV
jgi:putative FmdB family regulatory protein